jgi:hypothetical protein
VILLLTARTFFTAPSFQTPTTGVAQCGTGLMPSLTYIHLRGKKCKAIPVSGNGETQDCETSRLPYFLDNRFTGGGEVVSLKRRSLFTPKENSWFSFLRINPRPIVQLEGFGSIEKFNVIRNRTRDLSTHSMVPQLTTLPRVSTFIWCKRYMREVHMFCFLRKQRQVTKQPT